MIEYVLFGVVLACAAMQDFKRMKVSDLILANLWVLFVLLGLSGDIYLTACGVFGVLYLSNTLIHGFEGKPFVSWGDVLAIPPVYAVMYSMGAWVASLCLIGFAIPLLITYVKKKEQAVIPYLFAAYLIGLFAYSLS